MFVLYSVPVWIWLPSLKPKKCFELSSAPSQLSTGWLPREHLGRVEDNDDDSQTMVPLTWWGHPLACKRLEIGENGTHYERGLSQQMILYNFIILNVWDYEIGHFFLFCLTTYLTHQKSFFSSVVTMALIAILRLNKTADWLQLGNFHRVASVSIAMLTWIVSTPFSHQGRQN